MVVRSSREPSPVQIMTDQKQLENVEYSRYLGSMITNEARCTREIKSRIVMSKAAFNRNKTLFTSKLDLYLWKKLVKCYIWNIALFGAKLGHVRSLEIRSCRKMEKIRWTKCLRSEQVLLRVKMERNILHTVTRRKGD
jgi:hypothetical protein